MAAPDLSVVIPAFNEARRLGQSLEAIADYLDRTDRDAETIVVDDGSTDGTADLARRQLASRRGRVISNASNCGKGFSVRRGVLEAEGRTVLITDADLSCPIAEHSLLAAVMRDGAFEIVMGSRSLPDSRVEVHQHRGRELMGKTFNVFVRGLTGLPYVDTQCGFKLVDRERTRRVFERLTVSGFAYDVELLLLARRAGLRMTDVPVAWRNSPDSRVSLFGDSSRMLVDLARIALRARAAADPTDGWV